MNEKITISLCVGSACHLKGSREVIEAIQEEVANRGLGDQIELRAAFCLNHCGRDKDGITVKVNEDIFDGINLGNIAALFEEKVLPLLK